MVFSRVVVLDQFLISYMYLEKKENIGTHDRGGPKNGVFDLVPTVCGED